MATVSPLPEEPPALPDPVSPDQEQSPENRKIMSRRLIIQAKKELEDGERLQAGEKAWGAVARRLRELTGNRDLQIGDESNVGFSLRHLPNFDD